MKCLHCPISCKSPKGIAHWDLQLCGHCAYDKFPERFSRPIYSRESRPQFGKRKGTQEKYYGIGGRR